MVLVGTWISALVVTWVFGISPVLIPVAVISVVPVLAAILIAVVSVLLITFALSLITALIGVLIGILVRILGVGLRATLLSIITLLLIIASVTTLTRLSIVGPGPTLSIATALISLVRTASATRVVAASSHHQASYLIGVFHANQVAIGRKTVIDVAAVAITKIVVLVLDKSWLLRQSTIADVVHCLSNFTRRTQGTVAFFYTITDIVIVTAAPTIIASTLALVVAVAIVCSASSSTLPSRSWVVVGITPTPAAPRGWT